MRTTTTPGLMLGTVGYMPPEQVRGQPADGRSDIFSLGAILYEMVTGRRAFSAATPADTISAVLHRDPPEMTSGSAPVSDGLDRIVRRCLEKEPDDRFQTARDLAFALESQSGTSPSHAHPAAPTSSRRSWILAAGGALTMATLAIGTFLWSRHPSLPVPTGPGASRTLNTEGLGDLGSHIRNFERAASFVDDTRILMDARAPDGHVRTFLLDLAGGKPVGITPEGTVAVHGSLTGGWFLVVGPDRTLGWSSLDGGDVRPSPVRLPLRLTVEQANVPGRLDRFELATGRRTPWKILMPDDPAGVVSIQSTRVTADGRAYAYSYTRYQQDLYLVEGLR